MKHIKIILIGLFSLIALPCFAISDPQGSSDDSRIQYVDYNEQDVVVINALPGIGTRIVLDPEEVIIEIASGFMDGWEVTSSGHIIYLKARSVIVEEHTTTGTQVDVKQRAIEPEPKKWNTNLMVTTNKRLYDFDLKLIGNDNQALAQQAAYRVQFRYPQSNLNRTNQYLSEAYKTPASERSHVIRNTNYSMSVGEKSSMIAPKQVYDDGIFTYVTLQNNHDFPAFYIVMPDGSEKLIDVTINEKGQVVIHRVSPQFALRLNDAIVYIHNESFDSTGNQEVFDNKTTIPGTTRVIRGQ